MKKHYVIIVPGLGDETKKLQFATYHWRWFGLIPIVYSIGWRDGKDFRPKLNQIITLIDTYAQCGNAVSLVGTSAGGSAVINAFYKRKNNICKVINVCGRLKVGTHKGFRSFELRTKTSPAFAQSVLLCEKNLTSLTKSDKNKIMTVQAKFGDELVPSETTLIEGAFNATVPTLEHMFSIVLSLTLFSKPLILFLIESNNKQ